MGGSRHARRILPDMIMRYLTMTAALLWVFPGRLPV